MKKVLVAAMAVALAAAMCVPASAFENEFGGYWRTRAYTQQDFSGDKTESADLQQVDTRTRLYYTAKFSDDFKFVNKFEFDGVWGAQDDEDEANSYGDVGTDGINVEVKNSYVDFNLGYYNFKIGAQAGYLGRAFIMDEDFAGAVITGEFGGVSVPFYWIKQVEGGIGEDANDYDQDTIVISPEFKINNMSINPFILYTYQKEREVVEDSYVPVINQNTGSFGSKLVDGTEGREDFNAYNIGFNFDMSLDAVNVWTTMIYQFGSYDEVELNGTKNDRDINAYLVALGGNMDVGGIDIHGQFFYASGDDDANDKDDESFLDLTGGQSYYWSEIMGYGMVDNQVSAGSCADKISNIMALNVGASMSPMEKLTLGADIWYAALAEDDANKEDYLGTELDLTASYQIMDNLSLDLVAAYLFAGDATVAVDDDGDKVATSNDEDPYQFAAQLSLSF
jgi:outer membrane protein W